MSEDSPAPAWFWEIPKADAKHRPVMLVATHLLDPVPTEIHVFWNVWTGIPLDIMHAPVWHDVGHFERAHFSGAAAGTPSSHATF